ncbi:MAG: HipA domain-containing protein [Candidatus Nanopelagicales bacterium]
MARDRLTGRGKFSLAEAQPKIALRELPDGRWALPSGRAASSHVLNPCDARLPGVAHIEVAMMRLAASMGLPAASTRLERFGDIEVVISERFDRERVQTVRSGGFTKGSVPGTRAGPGPQVPGVGRAAAQCHLRRSLASQLGCGH